LKTLLKAISRVLVEATFKTAKQTFLDQEVREAEVDEFFERFKEASKKNKIKNIGEKNIDFWAKKPWKEFTKFVTELDETKTKTEEKKEAGIKVKAEGAELRAENEDWYVYKILNKDACILFGAGTRWCITDKQNDTFEDYKYYNDFYFLISKKMGKEEKEEDRDPWYKIALQVEMDGEKTYWDAQDVKHSTVPAGLRIPTFPIDEVEESIDIEGKVYKLTEFQNLKNLKVGRNLDLEGTNITSLPDGLEVGVDLRLAGTKITSLPDDLEVGRHLDLKNTNITSLPDGLKVNGDLYLEGTKITSLPDGLEVGGNLDLDNSKITSLPDGLKVGGYLDLSNTNITSLPDDLKVGGDLDLKRTPLAGKITSHPGVKGKIYS
jgi:hypothetical protein